MYTTYNIKHIFGRSDIESITYKLKISQSDITTKRHKVYLMRMIRMDYQRHLLAIIAALIYKFHAKKYASHILQYLLLFNRVAGTST